MIRHVTTPVVIFAAQPTHIRVLASGSGSNDRRPVLRWSDVAPPPLIKKSPQLSIYNQIRHTTLITLEQGIQFELHLFQELSN